jgi:hypothetical protein
MKIRTRVLVMRSFLRRTFCFADCAAMGCALSFRGWIVDTLSLAVTLVLILAGTGARENLGGSFFSCHDIASLQLDKFESRRGNVLNHGRCQICA